MIHQYWMQSEAPENISKIIDTWKTRYSVSHTLFDDAAARDFISNHYGGREIDTYDTCNIPAMKSDYFRWCVLETLGGLYVDTDVELLSDGVTDMAGSNGLLFIRNENIANDLIYVAKPQTALIKRTREQATYNIEKRMRSSVWSVTGPGIMTRLYRSERTLFDEWAVVTIQDVERYVRFVGNLEYKKMPSHWLGRKDLYTDSVA